MSTNPSRRTSHHAPWRAVSGYERKLSTRETVVDGVAHAPKAFLGLLRGENTGKMIVRL